MLYEVKQSLIYKAICALQIPDLRVYKAIRLVDANFCFVNAEFGDS